MTVDRMSPLDASFLHMEDNVSHMHIGSVAVFAGPPPPFAEVRAMLRGKLALVPRYRQVARFVPFDLGRPVWVDDEHFNLEYHLRHTALPSPGSEEQLRLLVSRLMGLQLDRARPLWEMWMVEGLEGDRWAIVSKVHHAIVDGVSGAELLSIIMDLSPEPSPPVPDHWEPEPGPSSLQLATQAISDMARSPYEQLRAARAALRVPRHAIAQLSEVLHGVRSMSNLAQQTPQSTLNGPIGPHRRYAWTDITVP
ncbi:MAG TPA: wax ester/triacylglycerol synthase domain-containing protein, partial [Acidimicrobiales bacterium]